MHHFTARVAKRAKVMFSQACVTHSVQLQGGGVTPGPGHNTCPLPPDQVRLQHPPSPLPPHQVRLQHPPIPPPPQDQVRLQHPPPPPLGPGQVTTPAPRRDCGQAGGTHPTGMHSCQIKYFHWLFLKITYCKIHNS